jgi:carboxypeptidase T
MKTIQAAIVFLLGLLLTMQAFGQPKYSRVKIYYDPANPVAQKKFVYSDLQVDHCTHEPNAFIVEIGENEVALLRASSYRYEILIDDLVQNFKQTSDVSGFFESEQVQNRMAFVSSCQQVSNIITTPPAFGPGSMGGYYTYDEMVTAMGYLVDNYPAIVDTFSIGRSHENRDIWCVKISDNVLTDENEPEALLNGLQHAREAITGTSLIFFMEYLVQHYATNTKVQQVVNNREIFIIPCSNPDGYVYNETIAPGGGGSWRKNRRNHGGGIYGVDMNRNYSVDWANCSAPITGPPLSCGSGSTSSDTYWGASAFSEPETQAIRNFVTTRNFKVAVDQHSNGAYYSLPFGRPSLPTNIMDPIDALVYTYTPALMGMYNCHRAGNSPQSVGYEVAGGYKDWMLKGDIGTGTKQKVYGLTGEANGGGFWPTTSEILPLCKELCFQNLQAVISAGSYADIQDVNDVILPAGFSGTLNFIVRRVGITDAPVTVSLVPLQNLQSAGAPVVINSFTNYHDSYSGSINYNLFPTMPNGQRIRFIWRVETGGIVTDDTITKFYNPTDIFYDDMETGVAGDNWNINGSWGHTSTGNGYGGSRALSESPSGNYAAGITGTNSTVTWNQTINLSDATAAWLSFWVRHRSENCRDNLRIEISTNGGGSYTSLCGKNTIAENFSSLGGQPGLTGIRENWTRELVDLTSYLGNSNVRFRFRFNSNPNDPADDYYRQEDDGFYLDNVRLMKSTVPLFTLPVDFISFNGRLLTNGTVQLDWQASADQQHDYFEVERSADRNTFISLGKITTAPPCSFTDVTVRQGNNYYRIKQVDKNGTVSYSKVINIIYNKGKIDFILYPNPVTDVLNLQIDADKPANYFVTITDLFGKKVYDKKITPAMSGTTMRINLQDKSAQVYILTIRNEQQEVVVTQKFIKQ